ncbi:hypothetical protein D1O33_02295 [Rhodococcus rhodochrous]|uniref:AMP-binding protein n=1 Tax=Rhodococcus rhodochrous TaxID=1829 RepID=UPI00132F382B|nr:AMP-binding protein [Rhodococcus rhodochrous]QHG80899.1 hypothetical protein D1O33_02295 [Rhodococcus rhodochrous]
MTALTVTELLERLADVDDRGLRFEETELSWREHVAQSRRRAALLRDLLDGPAPKHIGILMDNVPEFSLLLGAAAFSGSVVVGLNTTRRGAALARDIALADCRVVFTEAAHASLLDGVDLGDVRVIDVDSPEWTAMLAPFADTVGETASPSPDDLFMLIFTSGTSGDPKAVRCTHRKFTDPATMLATRFGLGPDDTVYVSMPLFHSNAMIAGWAIGLAARGSIALRRRFSASGFLPDVRRYGVTFANYVGKPLSYVVATPEQPDDHDNPLRIVYGNEASAADVAEFTRRFGARVVDGFGSTEGGIAIASAPDAPAGALGRLPEGIEILDPETGRRCPPAVFDANGRITNADAATGEVNVAAVFAYGGLRDFDLAVAFARFLDAQTDLGPKQMPGLIRVCSEFPRTATFKVLTRSLAAERWSCSDPVWLRERGDSEFRLLSDELVHLLEPASVGTSAR